MWGTVRIHDCFKVRSPPGCNTLTNLHESFASSVISISTAEINKKTNKYPDDGPQNKVGIKDRGFPQI